MLRRVLVANRGEIAVRIIATCHRLGIQTVLAASEPDLGSLPAQLAGQTVCLGPALAYLDAGAVVKAALTTGAEAVHPGYGFLAENPRLARACTDAGLVFIGPTEQQLAVAGDKLLARDRAAAVGIPVLPGGQVMHAGQAVAVGRRTGFPILVKAVGGGGGRGLRLVTELPDLPGAALQGMAEARAAFADDRIYLERFVSGARHVEVQLLGDGRDVVSLGDRDCSVQRRYQKVLEEAPAPGLAPELRDAVHTAAAAFARSLSYLGLGTAEFLLDPAEGAFYFMEFNARIQVEHPVTEAVSGIDLVAEQIAVAEGLPLRVHGPAAAASGHAIECRILAEDWRNGFAPSPGTITRAVFPAGPGIRTDTWVQAGTVVPPFYDSLLAKLVVSGPDRASASARLRAALGVCQIDGVATNLGMHAALSRDRSFLAGPVDTAYLARFLDRAQVVGAGHG